MKKLIKSILGFVFSFSLIVFIAVAVFGSRIGASDFFAEARTNDVTVRFYSDVSSSDQQERYFLEEKTYHPEEEIVYPEDASTQPTRESYSNDYHWQFSGWGDIDGNDVVLNELEEDTSVYAKYEMVQDTFTVSFYQEYIDYGSSILTTIKYRFDNTDRQYTGPTPTKRSTVAYNYKHSGWETKDRKPMVLSEITAADLTNNSINLYAVFEEELIDYNITYHLGDGTIEDLKTTYNFDDGEFSLQTPKPNVEGVTFVGWLGTDIPEGEPQKEVKINAQELGGLKEREYTAVYTSTEYTVTFEIFEEDTKHPGTVDKPSVKATYGTEIVINNEQSKITIGTEEVTASPSDENKAYTFTFDCFETDAHEVTRDISILVRFNSQPKVYEIHYDNNGGQTFYDQGNTYTIESGRVYLRTPVLAKYTFLGWQELQSEGGDVLVEEPIKWFDVSGEDDLKARYYKAKYAENLYTVTFVVENEDYGTISSNGKSGARLEISGIKEGTQIRRSGKSFFIGDVEVVATPKENDFQYRYSFSSSGWVSQEFYQTVTQSFEVTVVFSAVEIEYSLSYSTGIIEVYDMEDAMLFPGQALKYNEQFKIKYQIPDHHHIISFTLNQNDISSLLGDSTGEIVITLTEDYLIKNNFFVAIDLLETVDTYNVTISVNEDARGTVSKNQILNVEYGTDITILSHNNNALQIGSEVITTEAKGSTEDYFHYVFSRWDTKGKTFVDGNIEIVAVFEIEYEKYIITFDEARVSVQREDGETLTNVSTGEQLPYNTKIILTYNPTEHHHCSKFEINSTDYVEDISANGKVEYTTTHATNIVTEEELNKYQITFGDNVEVKKPGGETVASGDRVDALTNLEIRAILSKHYKISVFTIAGVNYNTGANPVTYIITGDAEVVFEEERDKIPITSAESQNGTFTLSVNSIEWEGEVTLSVQPAKYFKFKRAYYVVDGQEGETEIEDFTFQMPNDPITVYVEFEREYYYVENAENGIAITVKVSDVSAEPVLVFEEVSADFTNLVKSRISYKNLKIYNFKILVNGVELTGVDVLVTINIPEEFGEQKLDLFRAVEEDGSVTFDVLLFDKDETTVSFTADTFGKFVFVERPDETSSGGKPNTDTSEKSANSNTLIIVLSVVSGAVVLGGVVVAIIIIKKRKIHKK